MSNISTTLVRRPFSLKMMAPSTKVTTIEQQCHQNSLDHQLQVLGSGACFEERSKKHGRDKGSGKKRHKGSVLLECLLFGNIIGSQQ